MQGQTASMLAALDALYGASFAVADILRRAQSAALGAFGLGPQECPYGIDFRIVLASSRLFLRSAHPASLTIVAAPIKRPYIWDLAPSVSAIRYCLGAGLHVYLLEWLPNSDRNQNDGLDEYAEAISECGARISGETAGTRPFLVGHSLGGTLAAISCARTRDALRVSSSSERRFVLNRPRANSGTVSSRWFRRCCPTLVVFRARSYRMLRPWQLQARSYGRD